MSDKSRNGRVDANTKSSMGGRGNSEKASPAAIDRYIKGLHFPASKRDLLSQAKKNSAPDDVMKVLGKFSEHDYNNVTEIAKEIGQVK